MAAGTFGGASAFGGGQGGGVPTNGAGIGGDAYGGAVFVYAGSAAFETCTFNNNSATGGANGLGSFGTNPTFGSAQRRRGLYVNAGATATYPITGTPVFTGNTSVLDTNVSGPFNQLTGDSTLYVLTSGDSGFGTLRSAVQQAPAGGTILFNSAIAGKTITLKSEIVLGQAISINGSGSNITISGNNSNRIFLVPSAATGNISLNGLTLENGLAQGGSGGASQFGGGGAAGLGGAMLVMGGNVSVAGVNFTNNQAQGGSGGGGSLVNFGGGGGGGIMAGVNTPNATFGGGGGSGGDLSATGGVGGPTSISGLAALNGVAGGAGAGGGGGTSGTYTVQTGNNSAQVLQGGNGGAEGSRRRRIWI